MTTVRSVCVFCGSSTGARDAYVRQARALGELLARRGIQLVYGGASVGLMGVLADAVVAGGGRVVGVIPRALETREIAHRGIAELHVVESMHERKALMARLADAFVALPGGIGTLEELFEVWTWEQLGIHEKPLALLDAEGYWEPLVRLVDHMVREGFVREPQRRALLVSDDPAQLLERLRVPVPRDEPRWLDATQS